MGYRLYASEVAADTTLVTTAETVIATVAGVSTYRPGEVLAIAASASITTGTNTTALTFRVRRDSLTGTVVNEIDPVQIEAAAGSTEDHTILCQDQLAGEIANGTYVLTVQQTAASANGNALNADMTITGS